MAAVVEQLIRKNRRDKRRWRQAVEALKLPGAGVSSRTILKAGHRHHAVEVRQQTADRHLSGFPEGISKGRQHNQTARDAAAGPAAHAVRDGHLRANGRRLHANQRQLPTGHHQPAVLQVAVADAALNDLAQIAGNLGA